LGPAGRRVLKLPPPMKLHPLRGIGLMVLAVSTFACLDAISKLLTAHYAIATIVWARYLSCGWPAAWC